MKTKVSFLILLFTVSLFAVQNKPFNSAIAFEDSCRIDSTETKYLPLIWIDNGEQFSLLIEARDDSATDFSTDSAAVSIEAFQVFPFSPLNPNVTNAKYLTVLKSRSHPDSSTYPYGSKFILFDSLDIKSMDTGAVYLRNRVAMVTNSQDIYLYGDSLKTLQTTFNRGFSYISVPSWDYSPALTLKITGKASNLKRGVGSMWKFRVYQRQGSTVKQK